MATKLGIVNRALDLMGQAPVVDIDSPISREEKVMARWYDVSRLRVLAYHPWDFAEARYQCSRSGTPLFEYADKYRVPSNFLELVDIYVEDSGQYYSQVYGDIDWTREENDILLNMSGSTSINIVYTKDVEDVAKFSALFTAALERRLASDTCFAITRDLKLAASLVSQADDDMNKATSIDGQGKRVRRKEFSRAIAARCSGLGSSNPYRIR